jgi:hypothetical protein
VFGHGILRCKCGIVNWKYVTVGFVRLEFDTPDVVCVWFGLVYSCSIDLQQALTSAMRYRTSQGILRCKCGIVNWKYVTVGMGGYNAIWGVWYVWSEVSKM